MLTDYHADVAKKGVKYGDDADTADVAEAAAQYKPLTEYLTAKLGESIKEGKIAAPRLIDGL